MTGCEPVLLISASSLRPHCELPATPIILSSPKRSKATCGSTHHVSGDMIYVLNTVLVSQRAFAVPGTSLAVLYFGVLVVWVLSTLI